MGSVVTSFYVESCLCKQARSGKMSFGGFEYLDFISKTRLLD